MAASGTALSRVRVEAAIQTVRGTRVLLDRDLAFLYRVRTGDLLQAVRRHRARFPSDFMFRLTAEEFRNLRTQSVFSSSWGGRRSRPFVFTEQGVAMLSSVLRSTRAVRVNIEIMRAFVGLRWKLATHEELARKVHTLERKYDGQFRVVFDALRDLTARPESPRERIGFAEPRHVPRLGSGAGRRRIHQSP